MKNILAIFSLYILFIGAVPCADAFHTPKENIGITLNGNQHDHQNDEDACPPFCICACCGLNVVSNEMQMLSLTSKHNFIKSVSAQYKNNFSSTDFSSIWQPPKLG